MKNSKKKDSQNERQSFTFYRSFYKATRTLKSRDRLRIYDAIIEYALLGKEPEELEGIAQVVWDLVAPTLSKSRINFINASKNQTSASKADKEDTSRSNSLTESHPSEHASHSSSQTPPTDTDTSRDTITDRETNTRTDTKGEVIAVGQKPVPRPSPNASRGQRLEQEYLRKIRSDAMRRSLEEWFSYKRSRGQGYRSERSMQLFCENLKELADGNEHRAQTILKNSMANNWSGIFPLNDGYVPIAQRGEGYQRGYV